MVNTDENREHVDKRQTYFVLILMLLSVFLLISCRESDSQFFGPPVDLGYNFGYSRVYNKIQDYSYKRNQYERESIWDVEKYHNFDEFIIVKSYPEEGHEANKKYYIIDKLKGEFFGPYDYTEFLDSCNSFGIRLL